MEHLSLETLAGLVEATPDEAQSAHLATCEECALELQLLRDQTDALGRLPELRPPRGDWEVLEARLVSEGLVRRRRFSSTLASTPGWMRGVAAAALFVAGTVVGGALAGDGAPPGVDRRADGAPPLAIPAASATTVEEAAELIRVTERRYIDAIVQYRQLQQVGGEGEAEADPEQRFVALEYLLAATRPAVEEVPADPFLNGLLASIMAEREAARSQVVRRAAEWH